MPLLGLGLDTHPISTSGDVSCKPPTQAVSASCRPQCPPRESQRGLANRRSDRQFFATSSAAQNKTPTHSGFGAHASPQGTSRLVLPPAPPPPRRLPPQSPVLALPAVCMPFPAVSKWQLLVSTQVSAHIVTSREGCPATLWPPAALRWLTHRPASSERKIDGFWGLKGFRCALHPRVAPKTLCQTLEIAAAAVTRRMGTEPARTWGTCATPVPPRGHLGPTALLIRNASPGGRHLTPTSEAVGSWAWFRNQLLKPPFVTISASQGEEWHELYPQGCQDPAWAPGNSQLVTS